MEDIRYMRVWGLALWSVAVAGCSGATDEGEMDKSQEAVTIVSSSLKFVGNRVGTSRTGKIVREEAIQRGVRFRWVREVGEGRGAPDTELDSGPGEDIDRLSEAELAERMRLVAFIDGHEFLEAEVPLERARRYKAFKKGQRAGASEAELEALLPRGRGGFVGELVTAADEGERGRKQIHGSNNLAAQNNLLYPYSAQVVLDNTGSTNVIDGSEGSATLIGPSTAMSAAHVFWDEALDTWEALYKWSPGFDSADANPMPFGGWYGCYGVWIPSGYKTNENQNTWDYAIIDFNVGCNLVSQGVNSDRPGDSVGWLGNYTETAANIESRLTYLRGYPAASFTCGSPGVSCNIRVWGDTSSSSNTDVTGSQITHMADSHPGHSGSGLYQYFDPSCSGCDQGAYLIGIHRAGDSTMNYGRLYDAGVRSAMTAFSDDW